MGTQTGHEFKGRCGVALASTGAGEPERSECSRERLHGLDLLEIGCKEYGKEKNLVFCLE